MTTQESFEFLLAGDIVQWISFFITAAVLGFRYGCIRVKVDSEEACNDSRWNQAREWMNHHADHIEKTIKTANEINRKNWAVRDVHDSRIDALEERVKELEARPRGISYLDEVRNREEA